MSSIKPLFRPTSLPKLSSWDDPSFPSPPAIQPQLETKVQSLTYQSIGVIIVLGMVLAICISLTVVFTIKTTTTTLTTSTTRSPNPYACGSMTILNYTDFPGNDIAPTITMNYTDCCQFCLNTSSCVAFTWQISANGCYRKSSLGSGSVYMNAVISARY